MTRTNPKLIVGGCSFSSALGVEQEEKWPALVSARLKTQLIDEAAVAGSNYRIWRKITTHIHTGNVTNRDIVIIQYTEPHRTELYSPIQRTPDHPSLVPGDQNAQAEPYRDYGYIVKNKWGLDKNGVGDEKKIGKITMKFSCDEFDFEQFQVQHLMFQGYLKSLRFKHVYFLRGGNYSPELKDITDYPIIDCTDTLQHHLPNDVWHMNKQGHKIVAQRVMLRL